MKHYRKILLLLLICCMHGCVLNDRPKRSSEKSLITIDGANVVQTSRQFKRLRTESQSKHEEVRSEFEQHLIQPTTTRAARNEITRRNGNEEEKPS